MREDRGGAGGWGVVDVRRWRGTVHAREQYSRMNNAQRERLGHGNPSSLREAGN
jgi:hypothetical protein